MRAQFAILLILISFSRLGYTQLYFPNVQYYNSGIDRLLLKDSVKNDLSRTHLSMRPILDKRTERDSIFYKDTKHYYWITQKIFKENFLIFKGEDFWCSVDPVIDLVGGTDFSADSLDLLYWNTRGIRVQARFFEKVAFSTVFYENQAIVPTYVSDFIQASGELYPGVNFYSQQNGVVPGYARTKPFKTIGYDFAFAEGNVSIIANKNFNMQFGNGNQFIGNGHRSLLLSDFSTNYPFAKFEGNFWKDRIQYNAIYSLHQNLYRLPLFNSVEATYERKIGTFHYLDFAVTPNLQVGLFEGALWKRSDSLGTHSPNWLFTNPVPFVNSAIMSGKADYNDILGLNISFTFGHSRLYGQAVLDNGKFGGAQLGLKTYDLFTPKLDAQIEFNHASNTTYFASNKRYNYSHYNLPLAHPLSAGFSEIIMNWNYEIKEFFVSNRTIYYNQKAHDSLTDGTNILFGQLGTIQSPNTSTNVLLNNLEIGYRFNKNYNLQAVLGWQYRNSQSTGNRDITNYVYFGLRTNLRNKTLDF